MTETQVDLGGRKVNLITQLKEVEKTCLYAGNAYRAYNQDSHYKYTEELMSFFKKLLLDDGKISPVDNDYYELPAKVFFNPKKDNELIFLIKPRISLTLAQERPKTEGIHIEVCEYEPINTTNT
jgi:hypothetical protein